MMKKKVSKESGRAVPPPAPGEVLTGEEVQALLNISRTTLWKLRKEKDLPYSRVGKKYLYLRSEIFEWLKTQRDSSIRQLLISFDYNLPGPPPGER